MNRIGVAEQVVQVAEDFLVGAHQVITRTIWTGPEGRLNVPL